jgi:hypothetical protein
VATSAWAACPLRDDILVAKRTCRTAGAATLMLVDVAARRRSTAAQSVRLAESNATDAGQVRPLIVRRFKRCEVEEDAGAASPAPSLQGCRDQVPNPPVCNRPWEENSRS